MRSITESKTVQLWLKKSCGSEQSRKAYLQKFRRFCKHRDLNPDTLVSEWKQIRYDWKKRQQFLDKWVENIEQYIFNEIEHLAPLTKQQTSYIIISFFQHNKIPIEDVDMPKHPFVKYHNRDLQKSEIKRILEHSRIREKCFYLLMVESGLRPDTILKLRYGNIKEDFEAQRMPMRIDVPQAIIKDKVGDRFTFIGIDAYESLKEYLSTRQPLEDDDFLFERLKFRKSEGRLSESAIANIFRATVTRLGIVDKGVYKKPKKVRLYSLKKYWYNNNRAEEVYKKFWAGWSLGTQGHYISRDVEKHRRKYADVYPSLRIYQPETNEEIQQLREENLKLKEALTKMVMEQKGITQFLINKGIGTKEEIELYKERAKVLEPMLQEPTKKHKKKASLVDKD